MFRIKSFQALRPRGDLCARVASVPYDVVDRGEALALAGNNPLSFLHVARSEIDLPANVDPYSPEVYRKAADNFAALQKQGVLIREPRPMLYIYRLCRNGRYQHGIVACCHVKDYERNIIKKHEKTRVEKEEDRKRHITALRAHSGPVFLIYRDDPGIDHIRSETEQQPPLYQFTAPDGIEHAVWAVPDADKLTAAFHNVPAAYIADGHHRAAAAVSIAREFAQDPVERAGALSIKVRFDPDDDEINWFQAVLFPASQLEILPYNRLVRDLAGRNANDFLIAVKSNFKVERTNEKIPTRPGQINMFLNGAWFSLASRNAPENDLVAALDVSVLQTKLLERVLGIADPRTDKRIEFIGGIHGTGELERRVQDGRAAAAFSMHPVTVNQLLAISDAGQIMPPKSTWFEPKLRDGLLVHTF